MAWEYSQQRKGFSGCSRRKASITAAEGYIWLSMSLVSGKLRSLKIPS